jgi:hypothetical protein
MNFLMLGDFSKDATISCTLEYPGTGTPNRQTGSPATPNAAACPATIFAYFAIKSGLERVAENAEGGCSEGETFSLQFFYRTTVEFSILYPDYGRSCYYRYGLCYRFRQHAR